jgi:hypothetical protein
MEFHAQILRPADLFSNGGKTFHDKKEAGLAFDSFSSQFKMNIQGRANRVVDISKDPYANVRRIQAAVENIPNVLESSKQQLITLHLPC